MVDARQLAGPFSWRKVMAVVFSVGIRPRTGAILVLVAAGIFAYGFHDLQEAGILPGLSTLAFDISHVIPPDSWYGVLLKGIFNFNPAPTVVELIAWLVYLIPVMFFYLRPTGGRSVQPKTAAGSASA